MFHAKFAKVLEKIPLQRGRGWGGVLRGTCGGRGVGGRGDLARDGLHVARLQW